ncbi:MAG: Smr/MutS family protein [Candidatus Eisenbacteria bacterium]|nr:Smr/MutS family protein [Candidatus Eisenbacteria bacterium]
MDRESLIRLEFERVCAAIAQRAECDRARGALLAWSPPDDRGVLAREARRLDEALRRTREPGAWCAVGRGSVTTWLDPESRVDLDGAAMVTIEGWLAAARETREAWQDAGLRERFRELSDLADRLPELEPLRVELARSLAPDGTVRDEASPALRRARAGVLDGERRLHAQLERWAAGFGEGSYVTRFADRFVACIPAAGFARRRGIVHDTSNSGQSLFVEPLEACDGNNHLLELRATAQEEALRILRELAGAVAGAGDALLETEAVLADLDALRARARWAGEFGATVVPVAEGSLRLVRARHPLLAMGERRDDVVPLDLVLEPPGRLLLVSGPNMGGKTVLLKTVGLAVAMAHAALPVPAEEGSRVPPMDHLIVDLGDGQSVDQGLSTFAAHLRRLRRMAEVAGPRSLLLADELGAGTDPEEGAALGRALVEHFAARGAWGVLTTHLGSLKRVAGEVAGVVNGSLEFDLATLTPRYRFRAGVPGASHALAVAARLGFEPAVLERAAALTSDESRALERLLSELGDALVATGEERAALATARREADDAAAAHRRAAEDARRELAGMRRRLTGESEALLARARELWQDLQREARRAEKSAVAAQEARGRLEAIERETAELASRVAPAAAPPAGAPAGEIAVGKRVRVADLGIEAEIESLPDADGRLTLRRGSWSIQSHVSKLLAPSAEHAAPTRPAGASYDSAPEVPRLEVDLRGMEPDDALREVDQALDRAALASFHELRIIHGIGRGVLRAAVERHLKSHPQVESQRMGEGREGGRGVTVARLR